MFREEKHATAHSIPIIFQFILFYFSRFFFGAKIIFFEIKIA